MKVKESYLYGSVFCKEEKEPLEYEAVKLLRENNLKIATAESCTAGYVSKRIANVSGSSEVFDCGIVSYANSIKEKLLFVDKEMLSRYGAVSAPVAAQMAKGALIQSGSDIAVSVTGIAGPGSDMTNKPVGLVYIALCDKEDRLMVKEMHFKAPENTDIREYNRYLSASCALDMAITYLKEYPAIKEYQSYKDFLKKYCGKGK